MAWMSEYASCPGIPMSAIRTSVSRVKAFEASAHDRKAEPEAPVAARHGAVRLTKPFENVRKKVAGDALTRVSHDNHGPGIDASQLDLDLSALGGELHRVRHEIPDNLLQAVVIP